MREETVARSYAETLFELAVAHDGPEVFGVGVQFVATFMTDPRVLEFFCTPRISAAAKKSALNALAGPSLPPMLIRFLKVVVDKRRQRLLPQIAVAYQAILDKHQGRRHLDVTVARELDQAAQAELAARLSEATGDSVIPRISVRPEILGGVVIREADMVYDGSLKRQLDGIRHALMGARLPARNGRERQ